jgi:ABC-type tungstate transport system substrate-binding protein
VSRGRPTSIDYTEQMTGLRATTLIVALDDDVAGGEVGAAMLVGRGNVAWVTTQVTTVLWQ